MPINLSYPDNVELDPQQGHYIMFTINETEPAKVATGATGGDPAVAEIMSAAAGARSVRAGKKFIDSNLNAGSGKYTSTMSSAIKGSVYMSRPSTTRMAQAITLYMPPSVKVTYNANYKDEEIGFIASGLAATGTKMIEAFGAPGGGPRGQGGGNWEDRASAAFAAGGAAFMEGTVAFAADKAMKFADTFAPGAAALAQISAGAILGSKMEVLFTGVGRRAFSFQFNFIPKSEPESRTVYKIVQSFKEHMLPTYMSELDLSQIKLGKHKLGQGRVLKIPDTFDIFYFHHSNENPFLNRISTCYLTSMDIEYGGDKYVTYRPTKLNEHSRLAGPPPQKTSITLSFTEIETISRGRAEQGF